MTSLLLVFYIEYVRERGRERERERERKRKREREKVTSKGRDRVTRVCAYYF